jgi:carbonic anhydrase
MGGRRADGQPDRRDTGPDVRLLDAARQAVTVTDDHQFDDLLAANRTYADHFTMSGFDGIAHAGVAIVTCMDSRIDPLRLLGLQAGDAKIVRNPGGRVTEAALEAVILGVHLLGVDRVLVVPHTRCAVATHTQAELRDRVSESAGQDATWQIFHVVEDQEAALRDDVRKVRTHPLIPERIAVGGFIYDVDTGLLDRRV